MIWPLKRTIVVTVQKKKHGKYVNDTYQVTGRSGGVITVHNLLILIEKKWPWQLRGKK